ncbi:amino acid/amide ABC transporter substrate-binding protein, HAAT family [Variovorax sp. YR750]|uniref:ABC transporter substrate-binding protein n=1 Tax=Variovorax sp. YR750 TaxID=1884384 RepID=UPI0008BBF255|nr:ABC transporter substrate-binding protein [Variovorax sp. YR750]SEK99536.1 amino acid/amide ABC transporter substrate-binding protein, HAAT family [Variovorax sp. YR750]
MIHRIRSALLACALCTAALAASAQVKIGFIGTLSGPSAALGQDQYDGFMLAVEQRNGMLGGVPVAVVKEDDRQDPELGAQLVENLVQKDKVSFITGVTSSDVMMAMARPLARSGVLFVGSNAGPAPLAGRQCNNRFVFTSSQDEYQAGIVGRHAVDKGWWKTLFLAPDSPSGRDQLRGFRHFYSGEVVSELHARPGQADYSAELAKIKSVAPDAVVAFLPGQMGVDFIRQMNRSGLLGKVPLLTIGTVDGTTLPLLGDAALGALAGSVWGPDLPSPTNKAFVPAFERKYGRIPSQYAAQGFDAALLIDSALKETGGSVANRSDLRNALSRADFPSVRSGFKFLRNGFPVQDGHVFVVARDAQGRASLKRVATPLEANVDAYWNDCR